MGIMKSDPALFNANIFQCNKQKQTVLTKNVCGHNLPLEKNFLHDRNFTVYTVKILKSLEKLDTTFASRYVYQNILRL